MATPSLITYCTIEDGSDLEWTDRHSEIANEQGWGVVGKTVPVLVTRSPDRSPSVLVWVDCAEKAEAGDPVAARALAIVFGARAKRAHDSAQLDASGQVVIKDLAEAVRQGWKMEDTVRGVQIQAVHEPVCGIGAKAIEGPERFTSDDEAVAVLEEWADMGDDLATRALAIHYSEAAKHFRALSRADTRRTPPSGHGHVATTASGGAFAF